MLIPNKGLHKYTFENKTIYVGVASRDSQADKQSAVMVARADRLEPEYFNIIMRTRDTSVATRFMQSVKDTALPKDNKIIIRTATPCFWNPWRVVSRTEPRDVSSVILAGNIKDELIADMKEFMEAIDWYTGLGIPYRRGYLLYGPPGNGKSSLIAALAGHFGLNLYILSLAASKVNDANIDEVLSGVHNNSLILIEDIDCAFVKRINVVEETTEKAVATSGSPTPVAATADKSDKLSFSGLLNALDGVSCGQGRMIFMTTNHIERLDPALIRPGRVDIKKYIGNADQVQAKHLYQRFYKLSDNSSLASLFASYIPHQQISMAALQGHLMQHKSEPQAAIDNLFKLKESIECKQTAMTVTS